ncbi:hypothetical protein BGZ70_002647 [Mortierella alpina]|uniref:Integral membrane protein n=1 Tax=Mortierella alpina TaxID=64518 RepID=A0A9P6ITU6_MORAP|nr:hypothetical protein BGZ70_002647 [Mortierella alpina]
MAINRGNIVLVIGMLVAGTANTVISKYQDMACVKNCDSPNPKDHKHFEQPIWQTLNMFAGETLCLVLASVCAFLAEKYGRAKWAEMVLDEEDEDILAVVESDGLIVPPASHGRAHKNGHAAPLKKKQKLEGKYVFLLWLPTLCDMTASTLMNVGLIYCAASVYQMLRGALVIFTGILSVMFLGRRLLAFEWFALFTIVAGIATVGLASVISTNSSTVIGDTEPDEDEAIQTAKAFLGIFLVLFAQIFTATQFVVEEKFLSGYQIAPLRAVGYEGLFGTITVLGFMPILHYTLGAKYELFDLNVGWEQIRNSPQVWITAIIMLFSISSFNFFGISVTKTICATSRSTIDSCRTLFIWAISLYLGWEKFIPLQVLGFAMLVYGTFVFNGVIAPHVCAPPKAVHPDENRPLLVHDS